MSTKLLALHVICDAYSLIESIKTQAEDHSFRGTMPTDPELLRWGRTLETSLDRLDAVIQSLGGGVQS